MRRSIICTPHNMLLEWAGNAACMGEKCIQIFTGELGGKRYSGVTT